MFRFLGKTTINIRYSVVDVLVAAVLKLVAIAVVFELVAFYCTYAPRQLAKDNRMKANRSDHLPNH